MSERDKLLNYAAVCENLIHRIECSVMSDATIDAEITAWRYGLTVRRSEDEHSIWKFYLNDALVGTEFNYPVRPYTSSIDAVVDLLDADCRWSMGTLSRTPGYICWVESVHGGGHRLAPCAILIAILRRRATYAYAQAKRLEEEGK